MLKVVVFLVKEILCSIHSIFHRLHMNVMYRKEIQNFKEAVDRLFSKVET